MKISHSFFVLLCLVCIAKSEAQIIPDSLRVDWSQAGFEGVIPNPSLIIKISALMEMACMMTITLL